MTENRDLAREPCPDRIVEDLGGAFGMGCIGGYIWHFCKGWRNSPKGEKFGGALYSSRMRAPILGGNFAVWGGTFSSFDCSFQYLRKKDDHWNAIASGAATGGLLALRGGWRQASRQAVIGGILLAVIEGVMVIFSRKAASTPRDQYYQAMEMEQRMEQQKAAMEKTEQSPSPWLSSLSNFSTPAPTPPPSSSLDSGLDNSGSTSIEFAGEPNLGLSGNFSSFSSEYTPNTETVKRRWKWFT